MQLILGSSSPYRKALLERLLIPFECFSPDIDEDLIKENIADPIKAVQELSLQKGLAVQERFPNSMIISSDQMGVCQGEILNKAKTVEKAHEMLQFMQGKKHKLLTCFHIISPTKKIHHTDITTLYMRNLGPQEIERYVEKDRPLDCAGAYKLEKLGITLFDKIETQDATAIEGLPLMAVSKYLRELGLTLP